MSFLDCPEESAGPRVSVRSGVKQKDPESYKFTCRLRGGKKENQMLHSWRAALSEYPSCRRGDAGPEGGSDVAAGRGQDPRGPGWEKRAPCGGGLLPLYCH